MDNRTFATDLYEFLKDNDSLGHFEGIPTEAGISELEEYLSDLDMVNETIRDIEEIADSFDDHEAYVNDVKPLLKGLRAVQKNLEVEQSRRMVEDTKAEALRPEYRRGDMQLVLVDGGNGANANARGNAVFCTHLNDGSRTRFERYNVQGEMKELPA